VCNESGFFIHVRLIALIIEEGGGEKKKEEKAEQDSDGTVRVRSARKQNNAALL